jgi:DNA-directed RNA polymerase subunit RPC12/RpoP
MLNMFRTRAFLYKACPRCRGDLMLDPDLDEELGMEPSLEYVCLQCGRRISQKSQAAIRVRELSNVA